MHRCMFDQSAYISYPVDETVRAKETSTTTPATSQNTSSLRLAHLASFTPPYPVGINQPQYPGVFSNPSVGNGSFHTPLALPVQGHLGYSSPGYQNFTESPRPASIVHNIAPEFSPSFGTYTNYSGPGQVSQINTSLPACQSSSFCLDQHIGLNEPSVFNASQFNNKIQVQCHFTDNDRFSVQSTNPTQSNGPSLNWQRFNNNVPEHLMYAVDFNGNTDFQTNFDQNAAGTVLSSRQTDVGDFSQFCVANITGKNCAGLNNDLDKSGTLPNKENEKYDHQAEEREYYNLFMLKEKQKDSVKQKDTVKQKEQSWNNDTTSLSRAKPKAKKNTPNGPNQNNNRVLSQNERSSFLVPVNEADTTRPVKSSVHLIEGKDNSCVTANRADNTRKVETVVNNITTEHAPDYHAFSREYYQEYLKFVNKQKTEKLNADVEAFKDTGVVSSEKPASSFIRSRSEVDVDDGIKRVSLTYQCEDCKNTYDNIKELKKHIRKTHTKNKKRCETVEKSPTTEDTSVLDLIRSKKLDGVDMACENDENEIMETENENENSELQSYLCPYCGYDSQTLADSSEHLKNHEDEEESERAENECHKEEREYLQMSKDLDENRKKREEEDNREMVEERKQTERALLAKAKVKGDDEPFVLKKPSSQSKPYLKKLASRKEVEHTTLDKSSVHSSSPTEEHRIMPKRKAATQAKNNLMNPSKGKQKRVRDIRDLNKEDETLMEVFGIIPSKVCLSRVQESGNVDSQKEKKSVVNIVHDKVIKNKEVDDSERSPRKRNKTRNVWNKVISMSNCEPEIKDDVGNSDSKVLSDDSDVEVIEPPKTVIVLDDDIDESRKTHDSPKKTDKEMLKAFGIKDVAVKLDKTEKMCDKITSDRVKSRSKSDTELLQEFGIKDLSVSLTCASTNLRKAKPGPKSKTQIAKIQTAESKSTSSVSTTDFEEMSPDEIEKMLYECGMGISVPVSTKGIQDVEKHDRTPSPVPSTSKGHGHLKRKRTARKSTKDCALFKKYKLKDSKVILKSLSRIDVSLIRNPNSPFGKSDWLKHKFDSDTESDFEFDIPTPPLLEDFVESPALSKVDGKEQLEQSGKFGSQGKGGRKSPVKQKDLKIMEKFGILNSVVVIDSPKKRETVKVSETGKKKTLSDNELRKKFGIPSTIVVIDSPSKAHCKQETKKNQNTVGKTTGVISFAEFRSALDSARKNILSRLKNEDSSLVDGQNRDSNKESNIYRDAARQTRRKADVIEEKTVKSPKRQKLAGRNKEGKRSDLRSANIDCERLNDKTHAKTKPVPINKRIPYSGKSSEKRLKKILPSRLKTLSVKLDRLKLNEALKTYKAKAVSRAIEVRHKKNRNLKDIDEQIKLDNTNSSSSGQSRLRHKGSNVPLENSVKRKGQSVQEKQNENADGVKHSQVVKTARYRRSVGGKEQRLKGAETSNFKLQKMAKNLPLVKVNVPCLSSDEILRLSQNIHPVKGNSCSSEDLDVKKISEEVISQIIDKICCPEELTAETDEQLNEDVADNCSHSCNIERVKEPCTEAAQMKSIERDVTIEAKDGDNNYAVTEKRTVPSYSAEKDKKEVSKRVREKGNEREKTMCEAFPLEDSESDLSLISVMSENKETEYENFASKNLKGNISPVDSGIDDRNDYVIKESGRVCLVDIDSIPIGSSKFYDEDEKENSFDEVDGDIKDGKEGSSEKIIEKNAAVQDNGEKSEKKSVKSMKEVGHCKMNTEQEIVISTDNIVNALIESSDMIAHTSCSNDDKIHNKRESGDQRRSLNALELDSFNDENENHGVSKKSENKSEEENSLFDNELPAELKHALNKTEVSGSLEFNVDNTKNNEGEDVKGMRILSSIIDSESGSVIGDVYTLDEAAKSIRRETSDKEKDTIDVQKEHLTNANQPELALSNRETVMEH